LGFFSLSSGKRDIYILPAFPAAALLVGWFWSCWWERARDGWAAWAVRLPAFALALGLMGFAGGIWGGVEKVFPSKSTLLLPASAGVRLWMCALCVLAATLIGAAALTRRVRWLYVSVMGCTWLAMLTVVVWVYTPQFNVRYPIEAFAAKVNAEVPPDIPLQLCGPLNDLALRLNLGRHPTALSEMPEVRDYLGGEGKVYCVIDSEFYRQLVGLSELSSAVILSEKFGPTELLLVSNR
jgi:hypothetical protein